MTSMTYTGGLLPENGGRSKVLNLTGNTCVESILGACMMVRTNEFKEIGMFDENVVTLICKSEKVKKNIVNVLVKFDSKIKIA